jgi:hypothetical protein
VNSHKHQLVSQVVRKVLGEPLQILTSGMNLQNAKLHFMLAGSTRQLHPVEAMANKAVD